MAAEETRGATGGEAAEPGAGSAPRRYLVVANQTLGGEELTRALRERAARGPAEFWLVVPATPGHELAGRTVPMTPMPVMGGVLAVPESPEEGVRHAEEKLAAALRDLRAAGLKADGEVGDPEPMDAVRDTLARREFDEIIVSTFHERLSRWLHQDLPSRIEHRWHVPVTHVEAAERS